MSPDSAPVDEDDVISYLNTDLEVYSDQDLSPLVLAMGASVSVMYQGAFGSGHLASFEIGTADLCVSKDPDAVINGLCELTESLTSNLPSAAAALWHQSHTKTFNLGFQSGAKPPAFEVRLRPQTLARMAALEAGITITIYPA